MCSLYSCVEPPRSQSYLFYKANSPLCITLCSLYSAIFSHLLHISDEAQCSKLFSEIIRNSGGLRSYTVGGEG